MQFGATVKALMASGKVEAASSKKVLKVSDLKSIKRLKLIGEGAFGQVTQRSTHVM